MTDIVPLVFISFFALSVAATVGFGAMILTVVLASHLYPLPFLLAVGVPLNLALAMRIAWTQRAHISWPILLRQVLPWLGMGTTVGVLLFKALSEGQWLKFVFAAIVLSLSLRELWLSLRKVSKQALSPVSAAVALGVGGVIHGLFASGGPLVVYVIARRLEDKRAIRATLCMLWTSLNLILIGIYTARGDLDVESLKVTATLVPGLMLSLWVGNKLHDRLSGPVFRKAVFGLLAFGATMLLWRTWPS